MGWQSLMQADAPAAALTFLEQIIAASRGRAGDPRAGDDAAGSVAGDR